MESDGCNGVGGGDGGGDGDDHHSILAGLPDGFDVVLASDVVVPGFDTDKLLTSLMALLSRKPGSAAWLAYEFREEWETIGTFVGWAEEKGMKVTHEAIAADGSVDDDDDPEFFLYRLWWP